MACGKVAALGGGLFQLALPIPFEVGPVNLYLLAGGPEGPVLIDTGPKTASARATLGELLATVEVTPADLAHVVVTHAHIDHHGLAAELVAASGATLHVHEDDSHGVCEFSEFVASSAPLYLELARAWGFGRLGRELLQQFRHSFMKLADDVDRRSLHELSGPGGSVGLPGWNLRFIHCPGHTPGQICLYLPSHGVVFASDHLLEDITPNPAVYLPPYRGRATGLGHYLQSLEVLAGSVPAEVRVAPGHGPVFEGVRSRVAAIRHHHEERKVAILEILASGRSAAASLPPDWMEAAPDGGMTIAEVAACLWNDLSPGDFYLAAKEVHGHLELLEAEGRVARLSGGGVMGWHLP